ncbi:hypothetical protein [Spirosoma arcticum]
MYYKFLIVGLISLRCTVAAHGQCEVSQDADGQVYTTCVVERQELSPVKKAYLGCAFFTFPIWQSGTITLDSLGEEVTCQLAYNLIDNVLLCQTKGSMQSAPIKPYTFTINGVRFISQSSKLFGTTYRNYFSVLHDGKTQLLKKYKRRLIESRVLNKGGKDVNGYYQSLDSYFIKRINQEPVEIRLTRKSVLQALNDQTESLQNRLKSTKTTVDEIVDTIVYYDSLSTGQKVGF